MARALIVETFREGFLGNDPDFEGIAESKSYLQNGETPIFDTIEAAKEAFIEKIISRHSAARELIRRAFEQMTEIQFGDKNYGGMMDGQVTITVIPSQMVYIESCRLWENAVRCSITE